MRHSRNGTVSLPNGISVYLGDVAEDFRRESLTLSSEHDPISHDARPEDTSLEFTEPTLANVFLIYKDRADSITAIEMSFHLCVNRYNISVSQNVVSRILQSSSTKTTTEPPIIPSYRPQLSNITSIVSADDSKERFPFGKDQFSTMKSLLAFMLNGTSHWPHGVPGEYVGRVGWLILDAFRRMDKGQTIEDPVMEVMANVTRNIAASLSWK